MILIALLCFIVSFFGSNGREVFARNVANYDQNRQLEAAKQHGISLDTFRQIEGFRDGTSARLKKRSNVQYSTDHELISSLIRRSLDISLKNYNHRNAGKSDIVNRYKRSPLALPQPQPRGYRSGSSRSGSSRSGKSGKSGGSKGGILIGGTRGVRFSIGGLVGLIISGLIIVCFLGFGLYKCCKSYS